LEELFMLIHAVVRMSVHKQVASIMLLIGSLKN